MKRMPESITYLERLARIIGQRRQRCLQIQLPRYEIVVVQLQYLNTEWRTTPDGLLPFAYKTEAVCGRQDSD